MSFIGRTKHFLQRISLENKAFSARLKEYGWKVSSAAYLDGLFPPEKHPFYIRTVEQYVDRFMVPIVEKYKNWTEDQMPPRPAGKVPVWCCWWQGEDQMPELVRLCNTRMKQLFPHDEAELHLLTKENYKDFVTLPDHILQKFEAGKMSITALSDVLRVALLAQYGGFWIDATVFISDTFPREFLRHDYYAQRMYDPVKWRNEACKGRWCGFLMGGRPGNVIFLLLRDAFYEWWKDHNSVVDYVILDYFLLSGYKSLPSITRQIDTLPDNNVGVFDMYGKLHLPYSPGLYENLTRDTNLHKLTYKIDLYKQTQDGSPTLYAHLLQMVFGEVEK